MAVINIDGKEYMTENMSEESKATLISLQFVQGEQKRLEAQIAVYKTAERAYVVALKETLEKG
ncbi:hypothetical protein Syncc8109_0104 [Synechococcus sp. WH 8109]|uniref:DUF6447 family protein n=1 Tax=Synechococcus sp. WH 8109 TaxID=166314 RepID=UPI0003DFF1A7|nr:DUF6447 family protein [Synechococcus sp. WH 8109]AHF62525.1 hypothetical protein Syncc8109_0104 [Synechococcus sp. WH 8109]